MEGHNNAFHLIKICAQILKGEGKRCLYHEKHIAFADRGHVMRSRHGSWGLLANLAFESRAQGKASV